MPFSQSTIVSVSTPQIRGGQVYVSWTSTSPAGTWFQVYVNRRLAWTGYRRGTWLPIPTGPVRIDIGTVGPGEYDIDFSSTLPTAPARRARLDWHSGGYTGFDLAGFRIYGPKAPGGAIDRSRVLADITAYPLGIATGGFGLSGFGDGGFGQLTGHYSWTSDPLAAGSWTFAVIPYDAAGNDGAAQLTTVTIAAPPRPPSAFPGTSTRLEYTLNGFGRAGFGDGGFGLPEITLHWNPPGP